MIASSARSGHRPTARRVIVLGLALLAALAATPGLALIPADAPLVGPLGAPPAAAATTGLTMTADARYVVDPAKRRVHVAVALAATNHRKDTKTRRYFFDRVFLAVQPGTTAFKIASAGTNPTVRVERKAKTYTLLRIDFGKQLGAGGTRRFKLAFDIADPGGAATRTTRIGTTLASFAAWGFGTSGTPGGTVTVVFPKGFSVDVDAPELGKPTTDAAGNVTFATGRLATPLEFFAYFVADRPGAYKETTLQVAIGARTIPIVLRAWPDDPAWAKRVGSLLKRGLPALAKDIGLPWTVEEPLVVSEALSRSTTGFSGRYNPPAGQIEIAYYATSFVILHEAAHAWFDGALLADRWASEGFASYYALRAATAIGEKNVRGDVLTPALEKVAHPAQRLGGTGRGPGRGRERRIRGGPRARDRDRQAGGRRRARPGLAGDPRAPGRLPAERAAGEPRDERGTARLARLPRPARGADRRHVRRPLDEVGRPTRRCRAARRPGRDPRPLRSADATRGPLASAARGARLASRLAVRPDDRAARQRDPGARRSRRRRSTRPPAPD